MAGVGDLTSAFERLGLVRITPPQPDHVKVKICYTASFTCNFETDDTTDWIIEWYRHDDDDEEPRIAAITCRDVTDLFDHRYRIDKQKLEIDNIGPSDDGIYYVRQRKGYSIINHKSYCLWIMDPDEKKSWEDLTSPVKADDSYKDRKLDVLNIGDTLPMTGTLAWMFLDAVKFDGTKVKSFSEWKISNLENTFPMSKIKHLNVLLSNINYYPFVDFSLIKASLLKACRALKPDYSDDDELTGIEKVLQNQMLESCSRLILDCLALKLCELHGLELLTEQTVEGKHCCLKDDCEHDVSCKNNCNHVVSCKYDYLFRKDGRIIGLIEAKAMRKGAFKPDAIAQTIVGLMTLAAEQNDNRDGHAAPSAFCSLFAVLSDGYHYVFMLLNKNHLLILQDPDKTIKVIKAEKWSHLKLIFSIMNRLCNKAARDSELGNLSPI